MCAPLRHIAPNDIVQTVGVALGSEVWNTSGVITAAWPVRVAVSVLSGTAVFVAVDVLVTERGVEVIVGVCVGGGRGGQLGGRFAVTFTVTGTVGVSTLPAWSTPLTYLYTGPLPWIFTGETHVVCCPGHQPNLCLRLCLPGHGSGRSSDRGGLAQQGGVACGDFLPIRGACDLCIRWMGIECQLTPRASTTRPYIISSCKYMCYNITLVQGQAVSAPRRRSLAHLWDAAGVANLCDYRLLRVDVSRS